MPHKILKVLIACEESQRVCSAFRDLGHEAYSCDLQEPSGGHPEWHIYGDVLPLINGNCVFETMNGRKHVINGQWDILIAHPPCTYLSNAGACRLYPHKGEIDQERFKKGLAGKDFFLKFLAANCDHIAVENPVPSKIYNLPQYTQIIQPYEYGHPYTKKTCLWLKGLPPLRPTRIINPIGMWVNGNTKIYKRELLAGKVIGKEKDKKHRSKTFEGIALAMADQWSRYLIGKEVEHDV